MSEEAIKDGSSQIMSAKIFQILNTLKRVQGYEFIGFSDLQRITGIDLELHSDYVTVLQKNPKITIEGTRIKYSPLFTIKSLADLVDILEERNGLDEERFGITRDELIEACQNEQLAEQIEKQAINSGMCIVLKKGRSSTDKVFFPRGKRGLVELSGKFELKPNLAVLHCTDGEPSKEINRGEGVIVGIKGIQLARSEKISAAVDHFKRVSLRNETDHDGIKNLSENISPFSVSSLSGSHKNHLEEEHREIDFKFSFNEKRLPVDGLSSIKAEGETESSQVVKVFRYGCTNDMRDLWRQVTEKTLYKSEHEQILMREMVNEGLLLQQQMNSLNSKRQRNNINQGKKKKRRRMNRPLKITNTHMIQE
eukprot:snap_masked-scaffold_1-processed-gene-23.44-mRNA-1 protein AED:1.00 eAED:1.00 QI:0/-1/0/0/-1/1/1/0/365